MTNNLRWATERPNSRASVDLYWLPLGAGTGGQCVRGSGRLYEALTAMRAHRPRLDLYHSALIVHAGRPCICHRDGPGVGRGRSRPRRHLRRAGRFTFVGPVATLPLRDPLLARRHHPRHGRGGRQPRTPQHRPGHGPRGGEAGAVVSGPHVGPRRASHRRDVELQLADRAGCSPEAGTTPTPSDHLGVAARPDGARGCPWRPAPTPRSRARSLRPP